MESPIANNLLLLLQFLGRVQDSQSKVHLKRVEVSITMQQQEPLLNTERRDQTIHCFTNCMALPSQSVEVAGGGDGRIRIWTFVNSESGQVSTECVKDAFGAHPLQYFAENDTGQANRFVSGRRVEPASVCVIGSPQIINPD
jgi:hypothetical protein